MRQRLRFRLGLLGFLAGVPIALMPQMALLPLVTAASGVWLANWLYQRAGTISMPLAALMWTPVCALACGFVYGTALGLFAYDGGVVFGAAAFGIGGAIYSVVFAPIAALVVRSICKRPFTTAPLTGATDGGHPYRP